MQGQSKRLREPEVIERRASRTVGRQNVAQHLRVEVKDNPSPGRGAPSGSQLLFDEHDR